MNCTIARLAALLCIAFAVSATPALATNHDDPAGSGTGRSCGSGEGTMPDGYYRAWHTHDSRGSVTCTDGVTCTSSGTLQSNGTWAWTYACDGGAARPAPPRSTTIAVTPAPSVAAMRQ